MHSSNEKGQYTIRLGKPTSIDRVVLMEDQMNGQVIRSYQVHAQIVDSWDADSARMYLLSLFQMEQV